MTFHKMTSRNIPFCKSLLLLISVSMIAALVACSSSSPSTTTTPPPAISVSIPSPLQNLAVNGTSSVSATVLNDSANAGVNWTVTCGSAGACGSFNPTSTLSGVSTIYTAPAAIPTGGTVTITATSVTDPTKSASITVNITVPALTVTLTTVFSSVTVNEFIGITATVTNDPNLAGVSWSVSCGSTGACGSFSPTTTPSGVATTYHAPATVPTGNTVTITATSVTSPAVSASVIIVVTNPPTALTPGIYVFSLLGQESDGGSYSVAGAFTVSTGGAITSGEQDFIDVDPNTFQARPLKDSILNTSTYTTSSDGNLIISLVTGDSKIGVTAAAGNGTEILDATLVSGTRALIVEFDTSASASGSMDLQTASPAAPSGSYAFYVSGEDPALDSNIVAAIGGVINVDSPGGISGAGSAFDINDPTLPLEIYSDQLFSSGIVTGPDGLGRVEFLLTPASGNASDTGLINLVGYVVGPNHIRLVETGDDYGSVTGGIALAQGAFSNSSISGSSYVFGTAGFDNVGALQVAGVLTLTANSGSTTSGTVSGTLSFNDNSVLNVQGGTAFTGTYAVDPNATGRISLSNVTDGTGDTYNLQLYVTADGHATVISLDVADTLAGLGFQQTGPFTAASFSGGYAMNVGQAVVLNGFDVEQDGVGPVTADGSSVLAGFIDLNEGTTSVYSPVPDLTLSPASFSTTASGVFTGTITDPVSAATDNFTFYLVDTTKVVAIENDTNQLTLGYFEVQ
jgi:hypothetical protein